MTKAAKYQKYIYKNIILLDVPEEVFSLLTSPYNVF